MRSRFYSPKQTRGAGQKLSKHNLNLYKSMKMIKKQQINNNNNEVVVTRNIGEYTINLDHELGVGFSSNVYMGTHAKNDLKYAIKVIKLSEHTPSSVKMLKSQINILKNMSHPNIIHCYDVYSTEQYCYIMMEMCDGNLHQYIKRKGTLTSEQALCIIKQLIHGVSYLIRKGIIHRDIKPANILKKQQYWKIADFGFAIECAGDITTRFNVGTPLYMPVQVLLKNHYSSKSDIFAVGIVFYEMLCGFTPWQSRNQKQLIKKMIEIPLQIPKRVEICQQIQTIIRKMCAVRQQQRMSKQQFIILNIIKQEECNQVTVQNNPNQRRIMRAKSVQKNFGNIHSIYSLSTQAEYRQQQNQQHNSKDVLIAGLNYCRFLYYMLRNNEYFLIEERNRQIMCLIIFKHLYRIIQQLADSKNNWFNINNWQRFKISKQYITTHLTLKEYALRYEKQYMNYLQKIPLYLITQANQMVSDLFMEGRLTKKFHINMQQQLFEWIQQFIKNLLQKIKNRQQKQYNTSSKSKIIITQNNHQLNSILKGNIYALKTLHQYYKILQLQDKVCIEQLQQLKIIVNYNNAPQTILQDVYTIVKTMQ